MEFYIKQNATDPILKLRLIDDGKNDKSSFNDILETATITFEMFDIITNEYQILGASCQLVNRTKKFGQITDELYIIYRFTTTQTSTKGRFEGTVNITFEDGNVLIVPIKEKLFINIILYSQIN
jgi:hypothetical protein